MTDRTINLINSFSKTLRIDDVLHIIIAMQEEDDVAGVLPFPHMFKRLRNLCAHDPANFAEQLKKQVNKNCAVISFKSDIADSFTIQLHQFTAWMFYMYQETCIPEYILFWHSFYRLMCPAIGNIKYEKSMMFGFDKKKETKEWLIEFESKALELFGRVRNYNKEDEYYNRIYHENRQLFLRLAVPSLTEISNMFVTGQIDCCNADNIAGYLRLYKEREVSNEY